MVTKEEYTSIVNELSFKRQASISFLIIFIDLALFITGLLLVQQNQQLLYWLAQPLFAVVFLHGFLMLHEAGHNVCAESKTLNNIMGHYFSLFCCMPFYPWKYIHNEHHKWTGHLEKDPVFDLLKKAKVKKKLPLVMHIGWRSFLPIGVVFLHLVYWSYPIKLMLQKKMNKKIFINSIISVATLIIGYTILHYSNPTLFKLTNFLPAIFIYGILWELLSTPQHIGLPSTLNKPTLRDHANTTRSTYFPAILQKYLFFNFGMHVEHHFFPTLPWHELKKAQILLKPILKDNYNEVTGAVWNVSARSQNMESFLSIK